MAVREGYKQTEVGVIPNDWDAIDMGSLAHIQRGASPRPISSPIWFDKQSSIGWLRISDATKAKKYLLDTTQSLSELGIAHSRFVKQGCLVMSICATVGRPILLCKNVCIHDGFVVFNTLQVDKEYLYYVLTDIEGRWSKHGQTGSQMNLNTGLINSTPIPVPSTKAEQTAIANALSDVDALIQSLDALIAKKRLIKQGAMQTLLNPYDEQGQLKDGWVVKKLGGVGATYGGLTGKSKGDFGAGDSYYIPFLNVMNNIVIDTTFVENVRVEAGESQNYAKKGDLFFNGSSETPEELGLCALLNDEVECLYLNSFCFGFRLMAEKEINGLYLSYFFRSNYGRDLLYSLAQGATRYNLSKTNFLNLKLLIPEYREQTQIATILSDMDTEITALETKRSKVQAIKQGMMQNLLTGKIRLLDAQELAHARA